MRELIPVIPLSASQLQDVVYEIYCEAHELKCKAPMLCTPSPDTAQTSICKMAYASLIVAACMVHVMRLIAPLLLRNASRQ